MNCYYKEIVLRLLLMLWQLPQVILGFILSRNAEKKQFNGFEYYQWKRSGSISLGPYVIVDNPSSVAHERGHSVQSLILGPLYLIIIGLPSLLWCAIYIYTGIRKKTSYYCFYTEAWAENIRKRRKY